MVLWVQCTGLSRDEAAGGSASPRHFVVFQGRGAYSLEEDKRFWREQVVNLNVGYVVARENYCHVARNGFCGT